MNDQTRTEPNNIAIGIHAARARCETDSMDEIEVPVDRYSGAQTQCSLVHFSIGDDRMPKGGLSRLRLREKGGCVGQCRGRAVAALAGGSHLGAAGEAIAGKLYVRQTGSGSTQSMSFRILNLLSRRRTIL
jgi:fumarate hydratase, class II